MTSQKIIAILFFGTVAVLMYYSKTTRVRQSTTQMVVTNQDTVPVTVYLTLGGVPASDTASWVQNVNGLFGISGSGLVGSFNLAPADSLFYTPPAGKGIQGNFCFLTPAWQCAADSVDTGANVVEFCLNNAGTVVNAQETVEISCVSGVTYLAAVDFYSGGVWTCNYPGYDTITHIQNSVFGKNSGLPGVYPVGCDNCTEQTNQAPACTIGKSERPQKQAICNVQRNASYSGGQVVFSYLGPAWQILERDR